MREILFRGQTRKKMEEFDGVPELYEIIGNIHDNPELVST